MPFAKQEQIPNSPPKRTKIEPFSILVLFLSKPKRSEVWYIISGIGAVYHHGSAVYDPLSTWTILNNRYHR